MIRKAIIVMLALGTTGIVAYEILTFTGLCSWPSEAQAWVVMSIAVSAGSTIPLGILCSRSARFAGIRAGGRVGLLACGAIGSASGIIWCNSMFSGIGYSGSGLDLRVRDGGVYLSSVPTSWHGGWSGSSGFDVCLHPFVESTPPGISVFLPLWIPVLACALPWFIVWRRNSPPTPGRCGRCGYDLRGSTTPVCSECGRPFTDYRRRLLGLVEQLLDGMLTLSEFDDKFYSCYVERTPQWGLSKRDRAFFGTIHERLNWTGPQSDTESEPDDWMPEAEYIRFVRQQYDRYMVGLCLKCGHDLSGNVSGVCPECGTDVRSRNGEHHGKDR